MPVRIGSPGPSTLSALALGIPFSETTISAQFWVLPYISFHLACRRVEKRGRICDGTFVQHLEQKPPHPFPLKNKNLPVETRAASPQPFMFQYLCRRCARFYRQVLIFQREGMWRLLLQMWHK